MSSWASAWAMDISGVTPIERLVLIYLADCHDPSRNEVVCSDEWLADKTGLDITQLRGVLGSLRMAGLVDKDGHDLNLMRPRAVS